MHSQIRFLGISVGEICMATVNIVTFVQCRKSCLLQTATQFKLYHKEHIFFLLFAGLFYLLLERRQN